MNLAAVTTVPSDAGTTTSKVVTLQGSAGGRPIAESVIVGAAVTGTVTGSGAVPAGPRTPPGGGGGKGPGDERRRVPGGPRTPPGGGRSRGGGRDHRAERPRVEGVGAVPDEAHPRFAHEARRDHYSRSIDECPEQRHAGETRG